ncbi:hypothetical protein MBLNU459_g5403t1 [Dothideomycetes sp. NU459]
MSETTFAKSFLATLDKRAIKLSSDHVSDQRKYPAQSPYVLPRPTHPFPARARPANTGRPHTVSVSLKPMRATSDALALPDQPADTTVLDLKTRYAQKAGLDIAKVKLLYNKRPCSDLKTLKELLPQPTPKDVELSVMIMGGPAGASTPAASSPAASSPAIELPDPVAAPAVKSSDPLPEQSGDKDRPAPHLGESTAQILEGDEFWTDLRGFLVQRLRDESEGERLVALFRKSTT